MKEIDMNSKAMNELYINVEKDYENDIWTNQYGIKLYLKDMPLEQIDNAITFIKVNGCDSVFGLGGKWLPKLIDESVKRKMERCDVFHKNKS